MLRHERFIFLIVLYCTLCKLCLGGKVCRKQLESIPARSTVDCTGLPRIHDELPVIADECSRSIHAILSTVFTVGGVQMQLRKQSAKIPQTDFLMYFHFSACLLRKMEYNIVRGG